MKEIGLYIHIPFCKKKCDYCDFISFEGLNDIKSKYIKTLKNEISFYNNKNYIIDTIYIGGGTPSYIKSSLIKELLETIKINFKIKKNAEITIEVNPGTVNEQKLIDYKESGINRISLGLQSTNNEILKQIGRIHTYEDFLNTYEIIKKIGFKNINVDLIIGIPNQTIKMVENSIKEIIRLSPTHISLYSLIIEENTPLYNKVNKGEFFLIDDSKERKMYWLAKKELEKAGYIHYEISNFSKEGMCCLHNNNCWEQKEYLGFGLAAHSYIDGKRYSNTNYMNKYLEDFEKNIKVEEIQNLEDKQKEYMILGLRKINGVNINKFINKFSCNPLYVFKDEINKLKKIDLIEVDTNNIKLTNKGIDFANIVWQEFI